MLSISTGRCRAAMALLVLITGCAADPQQDDVVLDSARQAVTETDNGLTTVNGLTTTNGLRTLNV